MCRYSLEVAVKARRPHRDEVLRIRAIGHHVGFIGEDGEIVCLRQGTELEFTKPVRTTCGPLDQTTSTLAKFRYLRANRTGGRTYDVLDFADGKQLMVVWLKPRQKARILQLPAKRRRRKSITHKSPARQLEAV
jgi:hypothetical protein